MTFTYTGNPGQSPLEATRFLIGDTDSCDPLLQDGEIEYVLGQFNGAVLNAAIPCVYAIISKLTRLADESVGQVKIAYSQKAKAFRTTIQDLRNRIATTDITPYAGGVSVGDVISVSSNNGLVKPAFTKWMMTDTQSGGWVNNSPGPWYYYGVNG